MSAPTTAEVRGAMEQAAAAEQALAKSDTAATAFCAVRTVLECIAIPLAEHRDALAAEVARLREALAASEARAANPLGKHTCPACGKQSRVTTAGCDHCDYEDK